MQTSVRNKIIELLGNDELGITIADLSKSLKLERHTVAKYVESLVSESLVTFREVGRTKLWFLNKSPILSLLNSNNEMSVSFKDLLKGINENVYFVSKDKKIIWANNPKIKEGHTCFEKLQNKDICKECPVDKAYKSGKKETTHYKNKIHVSAVPIKDIRGKTVAFMELVGGK